MRQTLKNLHKRFPMMSLDELFDILDCFVDDAISTWEQPTLKTVPTNEPIKVWYGTNSGITTHDGNISTITTNDSCQLKSGH